MFKSAPHRSLASKRMWRFSLKYQSLLDSDLWLKMNLFTTVRQTYRTSLDLVGVDVVRSPETELLLPELSRLTWYLHPEETDLNTTKIYHPVGIWRFPIGRVAVACVEGTDLKTLDQWLILASEDSPSGCTPALAQALNEVKSAEPRFMKGKGYGVLYYKPDKVLFSSSELMLFRRFQGTLEAKQFLLERTHDADEEDHYPAENQNSAKFLDLKPESEMGRLGYSSSLSPSKRRDLIESVLIPNLGYEKVSRHLAWLIRNFKSQTDGEHRFANAISVWEHDLKLLERQHSAKRKQPENKRRNT